MKLYQIPDNSPLRIDVVGSKNDLATFFHIDGMYSYCESSDGLPFHLGASTEMILVDGRYEIAKQ